LGNTIQLPTIEPRVPLTTNPIIQVAAAIMPLCLFRRNGALLVSEHMRPVRSIADNQWFAKLTRHCVASSACLDVTGGSAPRRRVEDSGRIIGSRKNRRFYVVPGERIELPTNGLQNRHFPLSQPNETVGLTAKN
jgi:hypothetical protein